MRYVSSSPTRQRRSSSSSSSIVDISPTQQRRYRAWIQEAIYRKRYKLYVRKAPGWLGEYNRKITTSSARKFWTTELCTKYQPDPPRTIRYVPVPFRGYVQGPLLLLNDKVTTANTTATWCCVNRCFRTDRKRHARDACGFCTYVDNYDPSRSSLLEETTAITESSPSSAFSCLCDCAVFRYHMCWRGEYVREMRIRYDSTMVRYSSFSERALAYGKSDFVITHIDVGGDPSDKTVVVMITDLVSCALAAMGLAPVSSSSSSSSRIDDFSVRCHRCFATIRLADKKDRSLISFMNDLDHGDLAIVCTNSFAHQPTTRRLNRTFRKIVDLHARANPFCPYVADAIPRETLIELAKRRNDEFRNLIVYTTRFDLPGYGRRRMLVWNEIPISPSEDALFRRRDAADSGDSAGTEHTWCTRYDQWSTATAADMGTRTTDDLLDEDARNCVHVHARPLAAYRKTIEFARGTSRYYSKHDRARDRSTDRVLARANRLRLWLKERFDIDDEEASLNPSPSLTDVDNDEFRK